VDSAPALPGRVPQPPAEADWEPLARDWYLALAESGQAQFYEPSDWQTARILAGVLSRNLASDRMSAALLDSFLAGSARLLVTEADRRRMRLEIDRHNGDGEDAELTVLDDYRDALGG
jgi:hypothetical protein